MSVYFTKGKGWRYEFEVRGTRYTASRFKTKREARTALVARKEGLLHPRPSPEKTPEKTPTEIYLHSIGESERETMSILDREIGDGFQKDSHTNSHTDARPALKKDLSYIS